jgi:ankyrin repeat protein
LHNAVTFEKDQFAKAKEMVELLLAKGAKVNAKDDLGNTALHDLCSYSGGLSPAIAEILIANGAKVNIKDEDGVTPLSLAAQNGTIELIELLIKAGANVNSKDRCGTTVLGWGEDNPEVVKLLLRRGAK